MKESVKIFLESGLLESYLLGETNAEETSRVEAFVQKYPEVKKDLNHQHAIEYTTEKDVSVILPRILM